MNEIFEHDIQITAYGAAPARKTPATLAMGSAPQPSPLGAVRGAGAPPSKLERKLTLVLVSIGFCYYFILAETWKETVF